jgi:two-component system sensor histidine kinase DegS
VLHNAVKHSRASEVLIRLEVKEKWFELTVKDNGQGFAFGEKMKNSPVIHGRKATGNWLENMERRLAAIGGNCETQSTPGTGTRGCFSCNSRLRHSGN